MTIAKKLTCALAVALAITCCPAWAEDPAPAAPADPGTDASLMAQEKAAPASTDVWWGNRSIAFGNYIKFDKAKAEVCCCDHRKDCVAGCAQPCGNCASTPAGRNQVSPVVSSSVAALVLK